MLLIPALSKHRQQDQRFRVLVSYVANLRHEEGKEVKVLLFMRACLKSENNRDTDYRQYKKDGRTDRQTSKQTSWGSVAVIWAVYAVLGGNSGSCGCL